MHTHKPISAQQGAALIVFFLALLLTGTIIVVSSLSMEQGRTEHEKTTSRALAAAKEALIAYAATFQDTATAGGMPRAGLIGFLPCPEDTGSVAEGRSLGACGAQYESYLGRLPWKSLGIPPLKDGSGSCLWYAVSGDYKNSGGLDPAILPNPSGLSRTEMLNDDSYGSFQLRDSAGNVIKGATAEDRVVAVIIAPGSPVAGQNRTHDNTTQCGGDFTANRFMEIFNAVDNTTITAAADQIDQFITAERTNDAVFNDRIITITQAEIFDEIKRRGNFNTIVNNTTRELAECVAQFGLNNPAGGGGCDLNTCRQQCRTDRTNCRSQCDDDRQTCRTGCFWDYLSCLFSGGRPNVCNQVRNTCRNACNDTWTVCRDGCDTAFDICDADCVTNCSGGGGGNDFRLPWPAQLDLVDYRDSGEYVEDTAPGNHLGRFPIDVGDPSDLNNTLAVTGNPGNRFLLESNYCANLNTDALGVVPDQYNSIERRFWENWKDHFFYAVAGDYDASNASTPAVGACTNCLTTNTDATIDYAGIVFFAGERQGVQVRTTDNMNPPDAETKNLIGNYLEGSNAANYPDATGNGDYQTGTANDVAYCIQEDMTVIQCP